MAAVMVPGCVSPEERRVKEMRAKLDQYKEVTLTADVSWLSDEERDIISILIDVATVMDNIFWSQSYGDPFTMLETAEIQEEVDYSAINYGPWDRLDDNAPIIPGYESKPPGANFYPHDMTVGEFEAWSDQSKSCHYTLIERDSYGKLVSVPYSEAYREQHWMVADMMRSAARMAEDEGLKRYLNKRAEALISNNYQPSDFAWMEMRDSNIDFIVGPVETYEDRLFGYKAAHQALILLKDREWSARLDAFNEMLPRLQRELPVPDQYKSEVPGSESDIGVYYALYYAGDCNAGPKTIAVNLPNDPEVKSRAGDRKLQLKNAMEAKFDHILVPISEMLIDESQQSHITFDAFFENVTFHEVAHGMGVMNTINGRGTVREALREHYAVIEEAKADVMGLYLVSQLYEEGHIGSGELMDNYVTFFAGIFRSSRFGAGSAHGMANMLAMNYFASEGAFEYQKNGTYLVNFEKMRDAVVSLLRKIIIIQGDGDYEAASAWIEQDAVMSTMLRRDLDRVNAAGIPVDIVFNQGRDVLGIERRRPERRVVEPD